MLPHSPGLAKSLSVGSSIIALLAVLAVAWASLGLLAQQAEQQGLARAELAGAAARGYLVRVSDNLMSAAKVLAELPTLSRLLNQSDLQELTNFLDRYSRSSGLYASALLDSSGVLIAAGSDAPWAAVEAAYEEQGERFVLASPASSVILIGASAPVSGPEAMRVITLRAVDAQLLAKLQAQVGAAVNIINYATYKASADDPFTALHFQAVSTGHTAAKRLDSPDVYAATLLWLLAPDQLLGFIDVQLDAAEFDASAYELGRLLLIIAVVIMGLAALGGIWTGQWLARPLEALQSSADRIGRGDFSEAVPIKGVSEIAFLAITMNQMRHNLMDLTATLRRRDAEARAVLSGIVEGVYAVDSDRVIRYANDQVARTLRLQPTEIVGKFCGDVLRPETIDGVRPCEHDCPILAARHAQQGQAVERLSMPDGSVRSMLIVSSPPTDGQQVQVLRDDPDCSER